MNLDRLKSFFGRSRSNHFAEIRFFSEKDKNKLNAIFYDQVIEYMELALNLTQSRFESYITYLLNSDECVIFSCYDLKGNLAGITQLKNIDFHNRKCEMGGTWYGKKYQGSGINLACKQVILRFIFEDLVFRRLQFSIDVDNIASIKSMKKIGATMEGIFRNNWIDLDGNSRDDFYFSITDQDWKKLKNTIYKGF